MILVQIQIWFQEKIIYAPFSGLGGIVYDKDAIYIDTKGAQSFSKNVIRFIFL